MTAEQEAYEDALRSTVFQKPVTSSDGFSYIINSDKKSHCVSEECLGMRKNTVIPAAYNGKPVTVIGKNAFAGFKCARVTIPKSVTEIADASAGCSSPTEI